MFKIIKTKKSPHINICFKYKESIYRIYDVNMETERLRICGYRENTGKKEIVGSFTINMKDFIQYVNEELYKIISDPEEKKEIPNDILNYNKF